MDTAVKPQGCTNLKLRQLLRRVSRHYEAEMSKSGLKLTQYQLLSHVCKLGPLRPGDLARAMVIQPSTLTRNLQPLVAAGWLALSAGSDGRSRSVSATEAGRAKRQEAQRRWYAAQQTLNEILGIERVMALHALIDESMQLLSPQPGDEGEEDD